MPYEGLCKAGLWMDLCRLCARRAVDVLTPVWTVGENLWMDQRPAHNPQVSAISILRTPVE